MMDQNLAWIFNSTLPYWTWWRQVRFIDRKLKCRHATGDSGVRPVCFDWSFIFEP